MKKATQLQNSVDFFEIKDYFKKIGTNLQLRDKSVSVSFCPPTEFALARNLILDSADFSTTTARKRATDFSNEVSFCGVCRDSTRTCKKRKGESEGVQEGTVYSWCVEEESDLN